MTGVEREPLTITLPHATAGTTVYLVAAHCEPLAIRPTRQAAEQLCETAERATLADPDAATFTWWPIDEEDPDDGPAELYITTSGHEHRTEYTVTPIHLRQEQPPAPATDAPTEAAE